MSAPKIGTTSPLTLYSGGDPHKAIADAATGKIPSNSAVVKEAMSVLGLNESKHQRQLIEFMKPAGKGYVDPSSAWCASFVNASLERAGIKGTGSAAAGSFHKWGEKVTDPSKVKAGDVVVNNRRSPRTGMIGSHVDIATGPAFKDKNGNWVIPTVGGNVGAGVVGERQRRFDSHTVRAATPDLYKDPTKATAGAAGGLMGLTPGAAQTFGIPTQKEYQFPKEYSAATALSPAKGMTEAAATQMQARTQLPKTPEEPVVITPPIQPVAPSEPKAKPVAPSRKIVVNKQENRTVIEIAPKPVAKVSVAPEGNNDIKVTGLVTGERIRVIISNKGGLNTVIVPKSNEEITGIINSNPKSKVKIEITPTLIQNIESGARIAIKGAKKNQRVRVTVK